MYVNDIIFITVLLYMCLQYARTLSLRVRFLIHKHPLSVLSYCCMYVRICQYAPSELQEDAVRRADVAKVSQEPNLHR